jgi:hypothetical protein
MLPGGTDAQDNSRLEIPVPGLRRDLGLSDLLGVRESTKRTDWPYETHVAPFRNHRRNLRQDPGCERNELGGHWHRQHDCGLSEIHRLS